jgi:diaminobutyrate-2-oxoglutarate transaminase
MNINEASIFETLESEVRSYCRDWPAVFTSASGSWIRDENGREYLDFFAGAGALNYGHNNPVLKSALVDYIMSDGITHGLDMSTVAALKLARKVTGRSAVINFTNAFHGMTLGALSVTGNSMKRAGAGVPLVHTTPMPFDNYFDGVTEDFQWFSRVLDDSGSGINRPAAVIVETVQGEGGVNVARPEWLRALATLCSDRGILLIVDDVQMGCGRTGPFFSFEEAGIVPDIVTLSKSISGYGMPMALTLFKRELDVWGPGEHNGTFRGNNPAFVTSKVALDHYWSDDALTKTTLKKGARISECFANLSDQFPGEVSHRGRGLVQGLVFDQPERAGKVCQLAFDEGLLAETSGPSDQVVKLLPALTITDDELEHGLSILAEATLKVCS